MLPSGCLGVHACSLFIAALQRTSAWRSTELSAPELVSSTCCQRVIHSSEPRAVSDHRSRQTIAARPANFRLRQRVKLAMQLSWAAQRAAASGNNPMTVHKIAWASCVCCAATYSQHAATQQVHRSPACSSSSYAVWPTPRQQRPHHQLRLAASLPAPATTCWERRVF